MKNKYDCYKLYEEIKFLFKYDKYYLKGYWGKIIMSGGLTLSKMRLRSMILNGAIYLNEKSVKCWFKQVVAFMISFI